MIRVSLGQDVDKTTILCLSIYRQLRISTLFAQCSVVSFYILVLIHKRLFPAFTPSSREQPTDGSVAVCTVFPSATDVSIFVQSGVSEIVYYKPCCSLNCGIGAGSIGQLASFSTNSASRSPSLSILLAPWQHLQQLGLVSSHLVSSYNHTAIIFLNSQVVLMSTNT